MSQDPGIDCRHVGTGVRSRHRARVEAHGGIIDVPSEGPSAGHDVATGRERAWGHPPEHPVPNRMRWFVHDQGGPVVDWPAGGPGRHRAQAEVLEVTVEEWATGTGRTSLGHVDIISTGPADAGNTLQYQARMFTAGRPGEAVAATFLHQPDAGWLPVLARACAALAVAAPPSPPVGPNGEPRR